MLKSTIALLLLGVCSLLQAQNVVINELMASNDAYVADQDGEFDDWIELYNNSNQTVDLSGYHLSDNEDNRPKHTFDAGTTIAPFGYLTIWCDEDGMQTGHHANFKLSAAGEEVWLWSPDTLTQIDNVVYAGLNADEAYARVPNGTGNFQKQDGTFGYNNEESSALFSPAAAENLAFYPNPTTDEIVIESTLESPIEVYSLQGKRVILTTKPTNNRLSLGYLPKGIYVVRTGEYIGKVIIE